MSKNEYLLIKSKINTVRGLQRQKKYAQAEKEIQDVTNLAVIKVDEIVAEKEKELLEI